MATESGTFHVLVVDHEVVRSVSTSLGANYTPVPIPHLRLEECSPKNVDQDPSHPSASCHPCGACGACMVQSSHPYSSIFTLHVNDVSRAVLDLPLVRRRTEAPQKSPRVGPRVDPRMRPRMRPRECPRKRPQQHPRGLIFPAFSPSRTPHQNSHETSHEGVHGSGHESVH